MSTPSKRRLPKIQSSTADALERGKLKRSRALVSYKTGEQLSKASNPSQGPKHRERDTSLNHERPLATDPANLT